MQHEDTFRAMDTRVDVIVECAARPVADFVDVRLLFEQQEERFSRFRPSSLLSALNRGEMVEDAWFAAGCRLALEAVEMTGGLFNPLVLPALRAAGYDRTFAEVAGGRPARSPAPDAASALRIAGDTVSLAEGALDLGGIVKGWTVDVAVERLYARHVAVLVNAGGDLRCEGAEEGFDGWRLAVDGADESVAWEGVVRGAMATSTTLRRRWQTGDGMVAHHLIDPRTGLPAQSGIVQATVRASETWIAEIWAKAVVIGGEAAAAACVTAGHKLMTIGEDRSLREWR